MGSSGTAALRSAPPLSLVVVRQDSLVPEESFPTFVYKAYSNEAYARAFVEEGRVRLGALRQYKLTEDQNRRDTTEGEAHVRFPDGVTQVHFARDSSETFVSEAPGTMESRSSLGNPIFLFCTSLPSASEEFLRERFGPVLVTIENPEQFFDDVHRAMESTGWKFRLVATEVEYSKGDLIAADPGAFEGARLGYTQKPGEFSDESEFRFVAIILGTERPTELPEYIDLEIGRPVPYARLR